MKGQEGRATFGVNHVERSENISPFRVMVRVRVGVRVRVRVRYLIDICSKRYIL